jgi:hypothetical protein
MIQNYTQPKAIGNWIHYRKKSALVASGYRVGRRAPHSQSARHKKLWRFFCNDLADLLEPKAFVDTGASEIAPPKSRARAIWMHNHLEWLVTIQDRSDRADAVRHWRQDIQYIVEWLFPSANPDR